MTQFKTDSILCLLVISLCTLFSCHREHREQTKAMHSKGIYYWKTEFRLCPWEREFLEGHNISRLYLRLFDVDLDSSSREPVPVATIRLRDSLPANMETVPVVYITTASLQSGFSEKYARKLYQRVVAIARAGGFYPFKELQLDSDWTPSTREEYFLLCHAVGEMAHRDSIKLSSTIRLHQLRAQAPPVDRGVLMVYNTGPILRPGTSNSILELKDVEPYLKNRVRYPLPLAVSYPTYGWGVLFRDDRFQAILHRTDFSQRELYSKCGSSRFRVIKDHSIEGKRLKAGDRIRLEIPGMSTLKSVQALVSRTVNPEVEILLYHLDSASLSRYSTQQINSILDPR